MVAKDLEHDLIYEGWKTRRGQSHGFESSLRWLYPEELQYWASLLQVVTHARELFREKNVRFFGDGIPKVFLDAGAAITAPAVDRLLTWNQYS